MTKNIKLLNFLVSEEFKPTITKMKNMNINKLDIDLKRMIQRKIISIKVDNHNKLKNSSIDQETYLNIGLLLFLGR
jgi:hypothetical protein